MFKTLAYSLLAVVMMCGVSNADYVIDNFSFLDIPNDAGSTAAVGDHGGAITADVFSSTGVGVTASGGTGLYSFNAANGDSLHILYDWAGIYDDVPGHGDDLPGDRSLFGEPQSVVPADVLTGSLGDWDLVINTPGAVEASRTYDPSTTNFPPHDLLGATSLEFVFTYQGVGTSLIQFGGAQGLIATPEPTSMIMFGSIAAFGIARRRRKA